MREGSYTSNKLCPFYNCLSSVRQILTKFSLVFETEYMENVSWGKRDMVTYREASEFKNGSKIELKGQATFLKS